MPLPRSLTTATHADLDLAVVAGRWPDDCTGEVVISAPTPADDLSYALFGFGALIRLSLRPGRHGAADDRFAWRVRVLDTATRRLRDAAPDAFTAGPLGYTSPFGSPNMANTAPLPWGDRLFATWDVGRPIEVDPLTMEVLGELGHRDGWGRTFLGQDQVLPFYFSSAHPVIDPDRGCLWTVKLLPDEAFRLCPWIVRHDGDGTEVRAWPVQGAAVDGSMHTITQTPEWLVLADSGNFKVDPAEMATGVRTVTIDDEVTVYLVRKEAVEATPVGEPVPATAFPLAPTTGHYYAAYDDADGRVRILFEHMDRTDLGIHLRPDDLDAFGRPIDPAHAGLYCMAMGTSSVSEVVLDPTHGTATREVLVNEPWSWNHQLSAMDWSTEGLRSPTRHHLVFQGFRPHNVAQRTLQLYGDRVDRSSFPAEETAASLVSFDRDGLAVAARHEWADLGDLPSSPAFVPRAPGGPDRSRHAGADPGGHDGYVVCPVLSDGGFRVELFDAADVGRGPLAVLASPDRACVPLLLHSAWIPEARPAPPAERLRLGDEITEAHLAALPDDHLRDALRLVLADEAERSGAR